MEVEISASEFEALLQKYTVVRPQDYYDREINSNVSYRNDRIEDKRESSSVVDVTAVDAKFADSFWGSLQQIIASHTTNPADADKINTYFKQVTENYLHTYLYSYVLLYMYVYSL